MRDIFTSKQDSVADSPEIDRNAWVILHFIHGSTGSARSIIILFSRFEDAASEDLNVTSDAIGQCIRLASEKTTLVQVNANLKGQNGKLDRNLKASKTTCSDLTNEVDNWKAQKQQQTQLAHGLRFNLDRASEVLDDVRKDRDLLADTAMENEAEAKTLAENVLAEKKKTEMEESASGQTRPDSSKRKPRTIERTVQQAFNANPTGWLRWKSQYHQNLHLIIELPACLRVAPAGSHGEIEEEILDYQFSPSEDIWQMFKDDTAYYETLGTSPPYVRPADERSFHLS
ncbi:MAG: hypothetical protein Q9168_002203 [Polycauliona sp. 1 TL-2023]